MPEQRESSVEASGASDYLGSVTNRHANWRDVIVELTLLHSSCWVPRSLQARFSPGGDSSLCC
ncbi:hypothetical protein BN961_00349 [Afipia felis]|uniref:Uncharacterized protein n=1 Tax=Afipia felis TaxID=1035 RepID=A0A090N6J6_AFIFE|nr:hypothetical protein BN961_00349 [Afipia felis]